MTPIAKLLAIAGVSLVPSVASAQAGSCSPPPAGAKLDFEVLDPEVVRLHTHSANDIMDVSQKRSGIVNIGKRGRTMGLATYKPAFKIGGRPVITPTTGGVCVSMAEVKVSYGFEFHEVLVAKEFPVGSCEYEVVLEHEDTHVKFNRETLKEYSGRVQKELEAQLSGPQAVFTVDANAAVQKALGDLAAVVKPIVLEGQKVQQDKNAAIDTSFSYAEAFKKCGNWDQGNIWLDGLPKTSSEKSNSAPTLPPSRPTGDPFGLGKMPPRRD